MCRLSSVSSVTRTSSCSTPSRRSSSQSPPPSSTRPFIFGPSKDPPATRAMRRRPYGVSPRSRGGGTSNSILNSSSVLISGMTFPPLAELHGARSGSQSVDGDDQGKDQVQLGG